MLHFAVSHSYGHIIPDLLDCDLHINARTDLGETPLHLALDCVQIMMLLIGHGATVDTRDLADEIPLSVAVEIEQHDTIQYLVDLGADVNALTWRGSLLYIAARNGDTATVTILVSKNTLDVNIQNPNDKIPLHFAVVYRYEDIIRNLLEASANVNTVDRYNKTPLHYAANHPFLVSLRIAEMLVSSGAYGDIRDTSGNTAFDVLFDEYGHTRNRKHRITQLLERVQNNRFGKK
ncbi:ankyrin repeat-containing domain protein [Jimgerdemannia flammicorona]|uniref:Ankyrin repeat-containing domain protein n=1 Tax=Jimgerdemannia flammicorona TaxID=994334 RepID=A0A433QZX8_9FUNG|nr:ankyrin repeat-containing domain protein [Jimgerdemannia flammicorona]